MSSIDIWRNSSRDQPYAATAASLTARKRRVSASKTHIGLGLLSKRRR
jgi:hypothetical protein